MQLRRKSSAIKNNFDGSDYLIITTSNVKKGWHQKFSANESPVDVGWWGFNLTVFPDPNS